MKKVLALIVALVIVLSASCFAEGAFKMGIDAEYPPYSYMGDDGSYTGYDVEMCAACCEILGWDMEIVPINWDTKLMDLDSGNIDCIWSGLTIDVLDAEAYSISMAYADNSQMILTNKASGINSYEDLAGKIVGVQLGTSADIQLSDPEEAGELAATFGDLQRFENYNTCFLELQAGSIDAIAIDIGVAAGKIAEYGDDYFMLDEPWASEKYGICFRGADKEMCSAIEGAFMQLVENGTYVSLAEKYGLDTASLCLAK